MVDMRQRKRLEDELCIAR